MGYTDIFMVTLAEPFSWDKFDPNIANTPYNKPFGGLWFSPIVGDSCLWEIENRKHDYKSSACHDYRYLVEIDLSNVITLDKRGIDLIGFSRRGHINYEGAACIASGIYVTNYLVTMNYLLVNFSLASGCVWDASAILEVQRV